MALHLKKLFPVCLLICIRSTEAQNVDQGTLASIIKFLDNNYKVGQYAAAINVPQDQCQKNFIASSFLRNDSKTNVRNAIRGDTNPVYQGAELIAAGVQTKPHAAHSEFLLLNPPKNSPLTHLLNKRKNGCIVFYTLNSPCMNTCLTGKYNIIPGVDELQQYQGVKAFAFKNIWTHDQNNEKILKIKLKTIADRVPLFRCRNNNECILCGEPNSNVEVKEECVTT